MKASLKLLILAASIFAGGYAVGFFAPGHHHPRQRSDFSQKGNAFSFINPLLYCQDQTLDIKSGNDMESVVGAYLQKQKTAGAISDASFYFRDLNGGPWALVNPDFKPVPASLLKVPTAMSVYERAEADRAFLKKEITLPAGFDANSGEHFLPPERIESGKPYAVEELVRYMLQDSDNAAVYMLASVFDIKDIQNAYVRLGITPPTAGQTDYTVSVKTYASFFRVLFNATYLNKEDSEHVLSVLSRSSFTSGLVAGVPKDTTVAHKFGEAELPDGRLQLHDCGIVYKPNQPYLICIMTQGTSYDSLTTVVKTISKTVYDMLDS
jgi:beta-lactamase class A